MNMNHSFFFFLICLFIGACQTSSPKKELEFIPEPELTTFMKMPQWDSILMEHQVKGAILILDSTKNIYYGNDSNYSSKGYLPASTFKIPNSLVGLAAGVLKDENTIFPWDGEDRFMDGWEMDMTLDQAFKRSCLPCYQDMARKIGFKKMKELVKALKFGDMRVTEENFDRFWVDSDSKISPYEQIDFLLRVFSGSLLWEKEYIEVLKHIMILKSEPGYILRAKTGWSIEGDYNSGWYVGRLEKGEQVYYFATHVAPVDQSETSHFKMARIDVSLKALDMLGE